VGASVLMLLALASDNAAGWGALLTAGVIVSVVAARYPGARHQLYVGLLLRAVLMVMVIHGLDLPGEGRADRELFESDGWTLAQDGIQSPAQLLETGSGAYSLIIAICYMVVGRDPMVPATLSVLLGTLCILEVYRVSVLLWGEEAARRSAWMMALLPTPITYSALLLREGIVVYLAARGARHTVEGFAHERTSSFIASLLAFAVGGILHVGLTLMVPVSAILMLTNAFSIRGMNFKWGVKLGLAAVVGATVCVSLYQSGWGLDKLRKTVLKEDYAGPIVADATRFQAGSTYIQQEASSPADVARQTPLRLVLFLFTPFPWMVRSPRHIIGLIDALAYWYFAYRILRGWRSIRASSGARALLVLAVALLWVYAMGTASFGQGIRHRLKALPMLLSLAGAPRRPDVLEAGAKSMGVDRTC
jgi:hypothetical protein